MKILPILLTTFGLVGMLPGVSHGTNPATFVDDFDRPDSTDLGSGWLELSGEWEIRNQKLQATESTDGSWLAVHDLNDLPEQGFSASADLHLTDGGSLHGIAFHAQDPGNFYALLVHTGGIDFVKSIDGNLSALETVNYLLPIGPSQKVTVSSTFPGVFAYRVEETEGTTDLHTTITDPEPLTGGRAGVYSAIGHSGEFNRFELSIPLPETVAPGLTIQKALELAFPTEEGVTYQLQRSTDLMNWENHGEPVIGTGETIKEFVSVGDAERKFFRLLQVR